MPPVIGFLGLAFGIGTATFAGEAFLAGIIVSTATSLVIGQISKAFAKKPATAANPLAAEIASRTISSRQAAAPRRVLYGFVNVGGVITYLAVSGTSNEFLDVVYTLSGHAVNSILNMYFDGELVPVALGTVSTGKYAGVVPSVNWNFGERTDVAFAGLIAGSGGAWTANHRQRGCASVWLRLKYDATLFPNGLPNVTFDVQGKKVYDPRSGTIAFSSNAALCEADYIFNATYGLGAQSKYGLTGAQLSNSGLGAFSASNSVDGDVTTTGWNTSAATSGAYCHIDLGAGGDQAFRRFRMYLSATGYAGSYQIEYSDNDIAWTSANPAYDFTPDEVEWNEVELAPNGAHRYWRARLTNTPGAGASIREIDFWISDVDTSTLATAANTCDELVSVNIATTLTTAVAATGLQTVTAALMHDIVPGVVLHISDGGNSEDVTVSWVAADGLSFQATFAHTHSNGVSVSAGSEPRYCCNGSFTTDAAAQDVIPQLNSAHGGAAVYNAGKWGIYPAVWRGSSLNLGDADLRAPISVQTRVAHADLYNGVKGTFATPLNKWQMSDFPPYQDPAYVLEDDNEQLWLDSIYPFTFSSAACQRLSKIALRRKRRQIQIAQAQFMLQAWQVQVPDIVGFSHPRFSWTNKTFEVATCKLVYQQGAAPNEMIVGCDLSLIEADSTIYDWTAASDEDALSVVPTAILPAPGTVAAPTAFALTAISVTRAADGVAVSGVRLTWTAPADQAVKQGGLIRVQHKKHTDVDWIDDGALDGSTVVFDVIPLVDGIQYDFQIWAENIDGAKSAIVSGTKIPTASQLLIDTIGDGSNFYRPPQHITLPSDDPYNSGFEIFPDGQTIADGWTANYQFGGAGPTYSRNNAPYNGVYAQKLTNTNTNFGGMACRPIPVKPGLQYLARLRTEAAVNNTGRLYFVIDWFDDNADLTLSGGNFIGSSDSIAPAVNGTNYIDHTNIANSWTLYEITATAPATAKFARLRIMNWDAVGGGGTAGALSFDTVGFALEQVTDATPEAGVTSSPTTSSASYSTIPEMSIGLVTHGGDILLQFTGRISDTDYSFFSFFVDGVQIGQEYTHFGADTSFSISHIDPRGAGSHTYEVKWKSPSGATVTATGTSREFQVTEIT